MRNSRYSKNAEWQFKAYELGYTQSVLGVSHWKRGFSLLAEYFRVMNP